MKVYAVGIGPGDIGYIAPRAKEILQGCDVVVGYKLYLQLVEPLIEGKKVISSGMKGEKARCEEALKEAAKGAEVAVVSSGDTGIYGMASLLYEMSENYPNVEIEVIPGITAASSSASILGAPLSDDFAVISLSDLMTPWEVIEKRLEAASIGDFVICLYNPGSIKRKGYIGRACEIALKHKSPQTPCGYVKNALRQSLKEEAVLCTLKELACAPVDMFTTVIIGNGATTVIRGKLVTARGYKL